MKIIALERELPTTKSEDYTPELLKEEAEHVWNLYKSGKIRENYFREDVHAVVLILECNDKSEAENLLKEFPLVKASLITFEIIPLVNYDGLERLFDK